MLTTDNSPAPAPATNFDTAESDQIKIKFDTQRCIHSRHCVTELPKVFKANTPCAWLFPEKAAADVVAGVIRECPSGALTYESKIATVENEKRPEVNLMRIYENGPYAFLADMTIDGKDEGQRVTLCRCGLSKQKPFCDHSHAEAGFVATGEPDSHGIDALAVRGGPLSIDRTPNGPLLLKGNLEICAGTGRIFERCTQTALCRCGFSKSKPLCDGSHVAAKFMDEGPDLSKNPDLPHLSNDQAPH